MLSIATPPQSETHSCSGAVKRREDAPGSDWKLAPWDMDRYRRRGTKWMRQFDRQKDFDA